MGPQKKRRKAKYATEAVEASEAMVMTGIFGFLGDRGHDYFRRVKYLQIACIFVARVEEIQRDIRCITEPIERKYLRFLSNT